MYAVGLAYLNVGKASVSERLDELGVGERPGDAARVCLHVRPGRVNVGVDDRLATALAGRPLLLGG